MENRADQEKMVKNDEKVLDKQQQEKPNVIPLRPHLSHFKTEKEGSPAEWRQKNLLL